jgi:hypothetical protein
MLRKPAANIFFTFFLYLDKGTTYKSTNSSYSILAHFPMFRKNFMKNTKKSPIADALNVHEGLGNVQ